MRWLSRQRGTAEDMPQGKESTFSDKSWASFGFSGDWRRENIKRTYFWRSGVAVAILFFVTFSVIFYTSEHAPAFRTPKSRKSKRHLEMQAFGQDRDNKMSARDVHIIPETLSWHLRRGGTNPRPNRGDIGKESGNGIQRYAVGRMQEGRSPKPLEATAEKHLSGGEDITIGQKAEEETKFISGLREGLILPIRLKGIYMQSMSKRGNRLEEKFNYSKEINNLMQKGFGSETEDGKRTIKKAFRSRGAPFKLPGEENERRVKAPEPSLLTRSRRGRPITIFLDFHPKKEAGDRFNDDQLGRAEKVVDDEGNGMMMKLNLYLRKEAPKGRRRKVFERHAGEPFETDNKTAKRKSFGWFSNNKKKRNRPKECSIMGLNPRGKHITAKWKDENGDWIHAKRVAVKYWEKENN